jgi:hypothetical protein
MGCASLLSKCLVYWCMALAVRVRSLTLGRIPCSKMVISARMTVPSKRLAIDIRCMKLFRLILMVRGSSLQLRYISRCSSVLHSQIYQNVPKVFELYGMGEAKARLAEHMLCWVAAGLQSPLTNRCVPLPSNRKTLKKSNTSRDAFMFCRRLKIHLCLPRNPLLNYQHSLSFPKKKK